jgi:glycosyltransferase involved in cell wall biosynthesis
MVRAKFPGVIYHRLAENLGFGGGLAAGITAARRGGYRYFWLLDDDSRPAPFALKRFVEAADGIPDLGVLGVTGGTFRRGTLRYDPQSPGTTDSWRRSPELAACDWVHLDGALVSGEAVDQLGVPRRDFFMMLEDVEYSNRIQRAGWTVARFRIDEGLLGRGNLGSGGDGRPSPPWRGYYQTRNHLVMAIEHRSPAEVAGWLYRQLKFVGAAALSLDRKQERIRLRTLGAWHALRGVRGRSVEPAP